MKNLNVFTHQTVLPDSFLKKPEIAPKAKQDKKYGDKKI